MIAGPALFCGDSITVGLPPFVNVSGEKAVIAEGGKTSAWLRSQIEGLDRIGQAGQYKTALVLIGTNDIGGDVSESKFLENVLAIWSTLGFHNGVDVVAMTIPPFKGWANYAPRYAAIEARRRRFNELIVTWARSEAKVLVRLDQLLADTRDPERLAAAYDGGDHLHPRKDALGALLSQVVGGDPPGTRPASNPPKPLTPGQVVAVTPAPPPVLVPLAVVAGGAIVTYLLTRKRR